MGEQSPYISSSTESKVGSVLNTEHGFVENRGKTVDKSVLKAQELVNLAYSIVKEPKLLKMPENTQQDLLGPDMPPDTKLWTKNDKIHRASEARAQMLLDLRKEILRNLKTSKFLQSSTIEQIDKAKNVAQVLKSELMVFSRTQTNVLGTSDPSKPGDTQPSPLLKALKLHFSSNQDMPNSHTPGNPYQSTLSPMQFDTDTGLLKVSPSPNKPGSFRSKSGASSVLDLSSRTDDSKSKKSVGLMGPVTPRMPKTPAAYEGRATGGSILARRGIALPLKDFPRTRRASILQKMPSNRFSGLIGVHSALLKKSTQGSLGKFMDPAAPESLANSQLGISDLDRAPTIPKDPSISGFGNIAQLVSQNTQSLETEKVSIRKRASSYQTKDIVSNLALGTPKFGANLSRNSRSVNPPVISLNLLEGDDHNKHKEVSAVRSRLSAFGHSPEGSATRNTESPVGVKTSGNTPQERTHPEDGERLMFPVSGSRQTRESISQLQPPINMMIPVLEVSRDHQNSSATSRGLGVTTSSSSSSSSSSVNERRIPKSPSQYSPTRTPNKPEVKNVPMSLRVASGTSLVRAFKIGDNRSKSGGANGKRKTKRVHFKGLIRLKDNSDSMRKPPSKDECSVGKIVGQLGKHHETHLGDLTSARNSIWTKAVSSTNLEGFGHNQPESTVHFGDEAQVPFAAKLFNRQAFTSEKADDLRKRILEKYVRDNIKPILEKRPNMSNYEIDRLISSSQYPDVVKDSLEEHNRRRFKIASLKDPLLISMDKDMKTHREELKTKSFTQIIFGKILEKQIQERAVMAKEKELAKTQEAQKVIENKTAKEENKVKKIGLGVLSSVRLIRGGQARSGFETVKTISRNSSRISQREVDMTKQRAKPVIASRKLVPNMGSLGMVKSQREVGSQKSPPYKIPLQSSTTQMAESPQSRGSPSQSRWESPMPSRQRFDSDHQILEESQGEESIDEPPEDSAVMALSNRTLRDKWAKKTSFKLRVTNMDQ